MFFRGLGRRLYELSVEVWAFVFTESRDLLLDIWGTVRTDTRVVAEGIWGLVRDDVAPILTEDLPAGFAKAIAGGGESISASSILGGYWNAAGGDPEILAAINDATEGLPFPLDNLALLAGIGGVINASATLAALPRTFEASLEQEIAAVPTRGAAEWEFQRSILPEQTVAQWDAQRPLVPDQAAAAWEAQRPLVPDQQLTQWLAQQPLGEEQAVAAAEWELTANETVRPANIPTAQVIVAYRRGIIDRDQLEAFFARLGIPAEQIDPYLEVAKFYPTPSDIVTWISREVFEPEQIERYGLAADFDTLDLSLFEGAGISRDLARNFWIAHWDHPSFGQISQMFRRDILTSPGDRNATVPGSDAWRQQRQEGLDLMYAWHGLVETAPFWRDRFNLLAYNTLSRVDLRRMFDLGVIDEDQLRRGAADLGYDADGIEQYVLFTKAFSVVPSLLNRFAKGFIGLAEVEAGLRDIGIPESRVQTLIEEKVKPEQLDPTYDPELDITVAEIAKAVNKDLLTYDEGFDLVRALGFDEFEADLKLLTRVEAASGSPETFAEFQRMVQAYRRARRWDAKGVPGELLDLSRGIRDLRRQLAEHDGGDDDAPPRETLQSELTNRIQQLRALEERHGLRGRQEGA